MSDKRLQFFYHSPNNDPTIDKHLLLSQSVLTTEQQINQIISKLYISYRINPQTRLSKSQNNVFRDSISFNMKYFSDPNFDVLTPSSSEFLNTHPGIRIELTPTAFIISNPNTNDKKIFEYALNILNLLKPLETKIMTRELFIISSKINCKLWDHGEILCHVIDNRYSTPFEAKIILHVTTGIFQENYFRKLDKQSSEQYNLSQIHSLLLMEPNICTDPSPNVCRVKSALDWKQKQWICKRNLNNSDIYSKKEDPIPFEHTIPLPTLAHPITNVQIPDSILDVFSK